MSKPAVIYMIMNTITKKAYIGQTIRGMDVRWYCHVNDAMVGRSNTHFSRAIRKYGETAWDITILISDADVCALNSLEVNMIEKYDTFNNGYNSNKGGGTNLGYTHTEEQKRKIGAAHLGKKKKRSSVDKQIASLKGRVMPQDQKDKLIAKQLGVKSHHFIPWWIRYPDGSYEEHQTITKSDYAKLKGWSPGTFRDRFSVSKRVGQAGKKGIFKGVAVGNLGEHYE